jgi:hypothetical protein
LVIVIVLVPAALKDGGLKLAVAVAGSPATENVAVQRPVDAAIVTVTVPFVPAIRVLFPELVNVNPGIITSVAEVF